MSCKNSIEKETCYNSTNCGHDCNSGISYVIIIVLYILLAIILGACFFN